MAFTPRQQRFLNALTEKLREIEDTDLEIITNEGYHYGLRFLKESGRNLPRITFTPRGKDQRIKADVMRKAGLGVDDQLKCKAQHMKRKLGMRNASESETRILARRFNAYWNSYWATISRSIDALKDPQERFTRRGQTIAEPIQLLLGEKIPSVPAAKAEKGESASEKPYDALLAQFE